MEVVVLVRHPAAFIASFQNKNWRFPYRHFTSQPKLMEAFLEPYADRIREFEERRLNYDLVEGGALLWTILYDVLNQHGKIRPNWIWLRHEDLCIRPQDEFRALFKRLGLSVTPHVRNVIENTTSASNVLEASSRSTKLDRESKGLVSKWKNKLSKEEAKRIRALTERVSCKWYDDKWC